MALSDRMRSGTSAAPVPAVQQVQPVYQRPNVVRDLSLRAAPVVQGQRQFSPELAPARVLQPVITPLQRVAVQPQRNLFAPVPVLGNLLGEVAQRKPSAASVVAAALAQVSQPMTLSQRQIAGQQALQNQAFDAQMQNTKTIAAANPRMSESSEDAQYDQNQRVLRQMQQRAQTVQPFTGLPAGTVTRTQQEQRALTGFPQMTPQEVHNLDEGQLNALVDLAPSYNPLTGKKTGTPRSVAPYGYGAAGPVQSHTSADVMVGQGGGANHTTETDPAMLDAQQYIIEQNQRYADQLFPPIQAEMIRAGDPRLVQAAIDSLSGGTGAAGMIPRGGGSDEFLSHDYGPAIIDALKEYGGPAVESFARTPAGQKTLGLLDALNTGYEWNTENSAGVWLAVAQGDKPGYADNPLGDVMNMIPGSEYIALAPDVAAATLIYAAFPDIKQGVIDAAEHGYSSPTYAAAMEAAGIDDYPPQFTGNQAVHEYLIGQTDDWPPVLRDAFRLGEGLVMDPLTFAPVVGEAGKTIEAVGKVLATADDASALTRVAGRGLQATGRTIDLVSKLPDAPFELPAAAWGRWGRGSRVGEALAGHTPGMLALSTDQQYADAIASATYADELLRKNQDVGGNLPSAAAVANDLDRVASSATVPPTVIEHEADAVDGLASPRAPEPEIIRPDDEPTAEVPTSTSEAPERTDTVPQVQAREDPPVSAASSGGTTTPSVVRVDAASIPEEFPAVRAAVERYGTTPDVTGNVPGESAFTPVYGGSRLQDQPITRAVASGDLDAIARANELAEVTDTLTPILTDDPWYAPMNTSHGVNVDGRSVVPGMIPAQADALASMNAPGSRPVNPIHKAAGMGKAVLEDAAKLHFMAEHYAPLYREITGEIPANTATDRLFGYTWTGTGATGPTHRVQYLMERYVTTSSDEYANAILDWLRSTTGNDVLNITNGPQPYLQGIPDPFRDQVIQRLQDARHAYRSVVDATDDEFFAGITKPNMAAKPSSAVQLQGGLRDTSQAAARKAERWIEASTPLSEKAATESPTTAVATHAESAAPAPAPTKGWLAAKRSAAQRAADDSVVEGVRNPLLKFLNEVGANGFGREQTEYLNTVIDWRPPSEPGVVGDAWQPQEWTMIDAMLWGKNQVTIDPGFNYADFLQRIGEIHAGLPPRLTPAEKKATLQLARETGQPRPTFTESAAERTKATKLVRTYDTTLNKLRETSLFGPISGPAGYVGDVIGNAWAAIVNGHFGAAAEGLMPQKNIEALRTFRHTVVSPEGVNPWGVQFAADGMAHFRRDAHQAADALMDDFLRETGQLMPADLYPIGTLREVQTSGMPSVNEAVKNRNAVVRGTANIWSVPGVKDLRTSTDLLNRTSIAKRVSRDAARIDGIAAFRKRIEVLAGADNVDRIMSDILATAKERATEAGVSWKGNFSPADVRTATEGAPYSNNLSRAWQSELNKAIERGNLEQRRIFFSYKNTGADEAIGSVMMFHYWQTRASYMHLRATLRHPVLLNGYYKIWSTLKDRNEQSNLGYLGPVYKFMSGPSGIYAAIDPIGLLLPTTLLDMQDQEGNKLRALQNQLNPLIGSALAVAGMTDNVPNLTGFRTTERWLINMGNFLTAEGVDVSQVPLLGQIWDNNTMQLSMPIDDAVKSLLVGINQWAESKGIPVGQFAPFDRGANEQDQLNTWVIKLLEDKYGPSDTWETGQIDPATGQWVDGPAYQELDAALDALSTGTPNDIADQAEQLYATEGLMSALAAPVIPGGVITRSGYRDQQIAGNAADQQSASDNRDIATSANPAWVTMQQQWHDIGTPEQQYVYDTYMAIVAHPEDLRGLVTRLPNGSLAVVPTGGIAAMADDQRQDLANRWLTDNPGYEDAMLFVQNGRDAFKQAHPQMADYKEYQKAVYDDASGGPHAFRLSLVQTNANFRYQLNAYADYLKGQGVTGAELERRLDSWAASSNGYLAAMGLPIKNGDKPLPVYDPSQNPYANPALAGMAPGGSDSGARGAGSTLTKGPDGKLYNQDGQLVNQQGKPINDQGQIIDDYWYPEKVSERLADDVAQYDAVNQQMEQRFGPYWDEAAGYWSKDADSASERKKLGIYGIPYQLPSTSDLMRDFESWHYDHPDKTLEDWFTYLMGAPGYGVAGDPETALGYGEQSAEPTGLSARMIGGNGANGDADPRTWLWAVLHGATGYAPEGS